MVTMIEPVDARKPAVSAAALPKLPRSRTPRTRESDSWSRRTTANVSSVEPSSTTIISQARSIVFERGRDPGDQVGQRLGLVQRRDDDRDEPVFGSVIHRANRLRRRSRPA